MSGMTRLATRAPETARGLILGTVQYMAPEQVEGQEADARSDIWALGVVLTTSSPGGTITRIYGLEERGSNTPSNIMPYHWSSDGQMVFSQATMDAGYGIWTSSVEQ
jgi:serine/threonine protein kinase